MPNGKSMNRAVHGENGSTTHNSCTEQRHQLAQQIARLLADAWFRRRHDQQMRATVGSDVSPEDCPGRSHNEHDEGAETRPRC